MRSRLIALGASICSLAIVPAAPALAADQSGDNAGGSWGLQHE